MVLTILKNDGVRQWVSDDIPYIMEKKKYLKPPTRHIYIYIQVEEAEIGLSGKKRDTSQFQAMTGANALTFLEMCGHFGEVPYYHHQLNILVRW